MKKQTRLFGQEAKNGSEWKDMPEFVQQKQKELCIIVRFRTDEDLRKFSDLIGQKLTEKTKSIWYPFKSHWGETIMRWVDEP